ncbi:uncharacterized protein MONBRDRAFT_25669 [Monosiga brevicollis MX1]|uniref:Uncharacterized protein n=1 Tax=Monosiga brevicollis TaxID=81824 RepID=A9V027_MONBE|nr:uncharacterized protein MONBRDRAFT_25669 [Monosiga brevicollis MX1]EDQ89084.1 predicted protein [Monosiga brevicollis MX1]|eukprot:XP_001746189.1 hypothetical protein [Monosiga brevicollis MX1]
MAKIPALVGLLGLLITAGLAQIQQDPYLVLERRCEVEVSDDHPDFGSDNGILFFEPGQCAFLIEGFMNYQCLNNGSVLLTFYSSSDCIGPSYQYMLQPDDCLLYFVPECVYKLPESVGAITSYYNDDQCTSSAFFTTMHRTICDQSISLGGLQGINIAYECGHGEQADEIAGECLTYPSLYVFSKITALCLDNAVVLTAFTDDCESINFVVAVPPDECVAGLDLVSNATTLLLLDQFMRTEPADLHMSFSCLDKDAATMVLPSGILFICVLVAAIFVTLQY